ncbi:24668_t:CDS:1, partial [Entrophospora sp. SA101]
KKNLKDVKECLRQINDDNNNENLESSTTQQPISNFYEITLLTKKCNDYINWALIKAFVCCGISFSVVSNPYFISSSTTLSCISTTI